MVEHALRTNDAVALRTTAPNFIKRLTDRTYLAITRRDRRRRYAGGHCLSKLMWEIILEKGFPFGVGTWRQALLYVFSGAAGT